MPRAREIYDMIQVDRDELMTCWRDHGVERYPFKCERDRTLEELQDKIRKAFPDEFQDLPKGA